MYYDSPSSWVDAFKFCDSKRSHLAVPNSQAEIEFLWRMVLAMETVKRRGVWIGCKRESADSSFECAGNTEGMSFTNWAPGYPEQGAPRCVVMSKGLGTWKTNNCARPSYYKYVVCEMPNTPRVHCLKANANGHFVDDYRV
ncbi:C-type lectin domain family 10 member A-like [Patiria miniata]|uniref:C-type lectin domain-containing protein n=1 Tax=Patiria miniata TaxID=46514 RepID=A0A913Z9M6_PATMI|nr:C-type lectin domain family 10 member A-like [Patiria miniata]